MLLDLKYLYNFILYKNYVKFYFNIMETFETKEAEKSKLFLEVNFDYKYLSRT